MKAPAWMVIGFLVASYAILFTMAATVSMPLGFGALTAWGIISAAVFSTRVSLYCQFFKLVGLIAQPENAMGLLGLSAFAAAVFFMVALSARPTAYYWHASALVWLTLSLCLLCYLVGKFSATTIKVEVTAPATDSVVVSQARALTYPNSRKMLFGVNSDTKLL